jgi:hypothetical protein
MRGSIGVALRAMPRTKWPPRFTLSAQSWFNRDFPNFKPHHCDSDDVSDFDRRYNCIAWAASDTSRWWWPDDPVLGYGYWPAGIAREVTVVAFTAAFQTLRYSQCSDSSLESGFEKIAIFADSNSEPTHAARQLNDGIWTSKFGDFEDVRHVNLPCLEGPCYGRVTVFMKRQII